MRSWQKLRLADGGAAALVSVDPIGSQPASQPASQPVSQPVSQSVSQSAARITDDWSFVFRPDALTPTSATRLSSVESETAAVATALAELPWTRDADGRTPRSHSSIRPPSRTAMRRCSPTPSQRKEVTSAAPRFCAVSRLPLINWLPPRGGLMLGVGPHEASACRFTMWNQAVHSAKWGDSPRSSLCECIPFSTDSPQRPVVVTDRRSLSAGRDSPLPKMLTRQPAERAASAHAGLPKTTGARERGTAWQRTSSSSSGHSCRRSANGLAQQLSACHRATLHVAGHA
ncbi:hypothetical protein E2651_01165 [Streptomyces sp. MZ04]|nr:hypothetical protein E2651_01165 [Streptomyces sp. MZ04]